MKTIPLFKIICMLLATLWVSQLASQNNAEKGDRYFDQNLFESAIKYYLLDIQSKNRKTSDYAMQKLADCYRITGEFEKAEETYRKILKKKKKEAVSYLNYGLSLKSSAKYAEAILQFKEYIALKPEDPMGKVFLLSCDSAQKWLDETLGKEVKNLSKINSEQSDFSPVFYSPDKIFFSSSRRGSKQNLISFDGGAEVHRLDLYAIDICQLETNPQQKNDIINFREINTALHEGSACFSSDGRELYFTKTVKGSKNKDKNSILNTLQVYYSRIDSTGKWTKPSSAFLFNSLDYSIGHPSLSADGNTIFYMSDMPGGRGKTDIYYSIKQARGEWGAPINAGDEVNTFGHEMFPYAALSGQLYFSSNAHPGMGQLDIFKATNENGKWTKVANLKPPINSIGNDFGVALDGIYNRGFFSSDRFNGLGAEDIYSFSEEIPMTINILDDSLFFRDLAVFDDLKYKLGCETDSTATDLVSRNGGFGARLNPGKNYILQSSRFGMKYNEIKLRCEKDSVNKNFTFIVLSQHKDLNIQGSLFKGLKYSMETASANEKKPSLEAVSNKNEALPEREGYFSFKTVAEAGKQVLFADKVLEKPAE